MSVYELFFNTLVVELLILFVVFAFIGAWKMAEVIFDNEKGYGFNIFDELDKHEEQLRRANTRY